jgi:hypothetical protein
VVGEVSEDACDEQTTENGHQNHFTRHQIPVLQRPTGRHTEKNLLPTLIHRQRQSCLEPHPLLPKKAMKRRTGRFIG